MDPKLIALLEKGFALQQQGDLDAAEGAYLEVLNLDAPNEFALNLMGVVCIKRLQYKEAVGYLQKAMAINPSDAETYNNLGLAYKELKQFAAAQKAFEHSISLNPKQPIALNNIGNVMAAVDNHIPAIKCFEKALQLDSEYVDCLYNLSASLKEVGRLDQALATIQHAIDVNASGSQLLNRKGEILLRSTQFERAKEAFEQAIRINNNIVARINLSTAQKQLGEEELAIETLRRVLTEEPNNSEAHNHLGVLLNQLGDTKGAAEHFRLALKYTPNHASSYYQLSRLKDQRLTEQEVEKIGTLLKDPDLLEIFRFSLLFAMAWEHEKREDYETSIKYFIKGQAIKAARDPYDGEATLKFIDVCRRVFPLSVTPKQLTDDNFPVPVFVVGMPRSGTTLTEQIISSHSQISAAGEIPYMSDLVEVAATLTNRPFPDSIIFLAPEQRHQLRKMFLDRMVKQFGFNQFIVDKSPLNFNYLGIIAAIFPEAKILYCKRDPMDNCVSIFKLPFDTDQGYAHGLAALGHYYRQHEKLMKYWLACYPSRILTVQYEQTVENLEDQARRMLSFVGVEFEDQVINYFENQRIIMTPSADQVRQPIYKTSINAWQRYGPALQPLIDALEFA